MPPLNWNRQLAGLRRSRVLCGCLLAVLTGNLLAAEVTDLQRPLAQIRGVAPQGAGHREAMTAWTELASAPMDRLPEILAGMDGANILVCNWIRSLVETIVDRERKRGAALPAAALERFLAETQHAARARRLAYELIVQADPTAEQRLVAGLLNDPSMELRYDAVALELEKAAGQVATSPSAAIATYQRAFAAARDVQQVQLAADKLKELGAPVDLPKHYGFLLEWKLIGPFDNTDGRGYRLAYPPEQEVNLNAVYPGKVGDVAWIHFATSDTYGIVDLNAAYDRPKAANGSGYADTPESSRKCKGAVAYAYTEFVSDEPRDVELRLGSRNGHRVWLNGQLLYENNVYHTAMAVDQYRGKGRLERGRNTILVKLAQNEQTEDWAQDWNFQLRVCDEFGTAVLPNE